MMKVAMVKVVAGVEGHLMITEITMEKSWDLSRGGGWMYEDDHLAHLGLMVGIMYSSARAEKDRVAAENETIRQAFRQAVEPLVTLERPLGGVPAGPK